MVKQKTVCIIGAGVAGLAAAKTFAARGHRVTVLERSGHLGGVWEPARSYPEVQTQSPKDLYRYTDKPMPDSYPEWPNGPQVHAYLTEYAKDHGLMPRMRFNSTVVGMARRNSGVPGWLLEIRTSDKNVTRVEFDFVAVYIRAQEEMFRSWGIGAMSGAAHAVAKPLVWANWRALESLLKLQFKLKKCGMVPEQRIEDGVNCSVPIATPKFFPMVADGRIKAIRGTFDHYDGRTIVMTGGERVAADVVILAIGFKLGVPFLPEAYRNKLVEPDGQYRLYRVIANSDLPDMGFVGFNSSFCTVLCAEMAANWLVRYCDGQLANQPTAAEMSKNMDMMLHFRRVERPAASVYGGLCVAPYHFKHFDELLADMGATMRRRSPLVEKFAPPDADAYARFLASAPDYKVEPA